MSTRRTRAADIQRDDETVEPGAIRADAPPPGAPPLSAGGFARWVWRQLTSMRTALILLFLLAVAAVPGSVLPQRAQNPGKVGIFFTDHPTLAPWMDRAGLFSVYSSPWFAAVYLLLFTSLIGCIVPRVRLHARALRRRALLTPRVLARMPVYERWLTAAPAEQVLAAAESQLGDRRGWRPGHRVGRRCDPLAPVAAEAGALRETGNLLFHIALVVVLAGVAAGSLLGYRATTIVIEGGGFSNQYSSYGTALNTGALRGVASLPPFSVRLDSFDATFFTSGPNFGSGQDFRGRLTVTDTPDSAPRQATLRLNHPVPVDDANISLLGNGYAPIITVRDATGKVEYSAPTVFLPTDAKYTSEGVVKVPAASPRGLQVIGIFLPTGATGVQRSLFAGPGNPMLRMLAYRGDYTLAAGPGSIYTADRTLIDSGVLKPFTTATGAPMSFTLKGGESFQLPDGAGSISFDGFKRFANVQIVSDPGAPWVLAGAVAAVVGLCLSLFVRRRRWWVRASTDSAGRTVVEVAGLDRTDNAELAEEFAELVAAVGRAGPPLPVDGHAPTDDGAAGPDSPDETSPDETSPDERNTRTPA